MSRVEGAELYYLVDNRCMLHKIVWRIEDRIVTVFAITHYRAGVT